MPNQNNVDAWDIVIDEVTIMASEVISVLAGYAAVRHRSLGKVEFFVGANHGHICVVVTEPWKAVDYVTSLSVEGDPTDPARASAFGYVKRVLMKGQTCYWSA